VPPGADAPFAPRPAAIGSDVISGNLSKLAFIEGVQTWGASPANHNRDNDYHDIWHDNYRRLQLLLCGPALIFWSLNILRDFSFVTYTRAHETDGQTKSSAQCGTLRLLYGDWIYRMTVTVHLM